MSKPKGVSASPEPIDSQQVFLSKGGKTSGPFTEAEISAMKKSGEIHDYAFIWDLSAGQWKPIDPPPPPPSDLRTATPVESTQAPKKTQELKVPAVEAVCFDQLSVVNGRLERVTEEGCEFVSDAGGSEPGFATRHSLTLNLLNPKTGKSMNVRARLTQVSRRQGQWALSLRWDRCPEILL